MESTVLLAASAAGVGLMHTLLGPDHYLPFVMLARSRGWGLARTLALTLLCGLGHVGSSLLLGSLGLALGYGIGQVEGLEASRGDLAAWALVAFGVAYGAWGLRRALRRRTGAVFHRHGGRLHVHLHGDRDHAHDGHAEPAAGRSPVGWTLFAIFVLGPCEPLVPFFLVPAASGDWGGAALTCVAFTVATLATMLGAVALGVLGLSRAPLGALERWMEPVAGGTIAASGLAILYLGL